MIFLVLGLGILTGLIFLIWLLALIRLVLCLRFLTGLILLVRFLVLILLVFRVGVFGRLILLVLFVLILFLILLVFLLLLLLLLLLQFIQFFLHEVAIELSIGVIGAELQRGVIRLYRLLPGLNGLLRIGRLGRLACAIKRIAEVVISILLRGQTLGIGGRFFTKRLLKRLCRLRKLARLVSRRARVKHEIRLFGIALCGGGIFALSGGKISLLIIPFGCRWRGLRVMERQEQKCAEQCRRRLR